MNPENILKTLKIKKLKHDINNCKKLTDSDILFIKTFDTADLLYIISIYDNTVHSLSNLLVDLLN